MFNNLASYLLGYTSQEPAAAESQAAIETETRLTAVVADDDWVLVDRDSEGNSDAGSCCSSLESIPDAPDHHRRRRHHPPSTTSTAALLTRTSSTSSLPCANVEESWFLTPPPCFTSAGPIHMETSPLENLLIEHPSMSVYQHSHHSGGPAALTVAIMTPGRRRGSMPASPAPSIRSDAVEDIEEEAEEEEEMMSEAATDRLDERGVAAPRRGTVDTLRQQERQCLKIKSAQKLQIQKACQSLKRGYIERNNKAREVNCRNHRQRRGERSQGSARSNANNNRKCC